MSQAENKITKDISFAAKYLAAGKLVAFPTETVYGLGGDARNLTAIKRIFTLKGRPANNPLIVHLANIDQMKEWAINLPDEAIQLATHFWPGPLTLVLQKHPSVLAELTGGHPTIALRIPAHPITLRLLELFGDGLAGPSANQYTQISPTNAAAVQAELDQGLDLILDGGDCQIGIESTILDLSREMPIIVRPGMISAFEISQKLNRNVEIMHQSSTQIYPGKHYLHYAPKTPSFLMEREKIAQQDKGCGIILCGEIDASYPGIVKNLTNNPKIYAKYFYQSLRELDNLGLTQILIEIPPNERAWEGIIDRIKKACGRRKIN